MAKTAQQKAARKRTPKRNGVDLNLLPDRLKEHFTGRRPTSEEVLSAWTWYRLGVEDNQAQADAHLEAERNMMRLILQTDPERRAEVVAHDSLDVSPAIAAEKKWTPTRNLHPDQGKPYEGPVGNKAGDELSQYVSNDAKEEPATASDETTGDDETMADGSPIPPEYKKIGRYTPDDIAPYIDQASALAKTPERGIQIARTQLRDAEKGSNQIPGSMMTIIRSSLQKEGQLRVGDMSGPLLELDGSPHR